MAMLGKRRPPRTANERVRRERGSATRRDDATADGLSIERLAHDGRGVARDPHGKTVFVDQALPGERVRVAVHRQRKRFDEAHVVERLATSPERATPPCAYYGRCGGCDLQHLDLEAQREHKRRTLDELFTRQGLTLPEIEVLAGEGLAYRRRARLGVKCDAEGTPHLGFRARGSEHLIDIDSCVVLEPVLSRLIAPLRACLVQLEAPRRVGHIELIATAEGACVVVRQLREVPGDEARWRRFAAEHDVTLAWRVGREAPTLRWLHAPRGEALHVTLVLDDTTLSLGCVPGDFLQINADVNARLVRTALAWLAPRGEERVLDLFAGVGNFTLALAPRVASITGIEGSPAMVERLADNARRAGLHQVGAQQSDLATQVPEVAAVDWVIMDPPRGGAEALCRALADSPVTTLLYVSCDPAALARDAARLVQGGYRIQRAALADMFPHTAHLESMLLLTRDTPRGRSTSVEREDHGQGP
ncbi:methyltransferase domain-containing protein [Chromohalobacter israelensis]|uniref:23S rRNA (uracil(1939)-C(5))-methyltransferase RlmD n=1 Tax=Chromohalobacter israelensis (strain ATCC BAA-138 / DSM 3043 / CIP 106854 / NCIMB 13768 / 1H11) TaxID=290398 RepID=RLMD_CHRI1|nr:methyltransferase domain-containing protein [Chromohalobacter salexigens]Q1QX18.1 RecName: Full=23S rRNA (uracil(1939)-C(5))-methyltransferase RlmD; AltName: Full=23S rRNA(m5U1939)-methyltransferase [Chromohalobacter salexigens DSM 3043]ABE58990.1 23S rRNA m(5)U-1939 methyltransferase [Chromohalobacter salexigens DSM 3043]